ncbi:hypothetical protein M8818_000332 [Zalaria obscura]|uniref:Uncharacterized protein n=1 Tax=Zalaria obscura TaxID=2024903 RepID=A0ACC3SPK2_9PEZI
MAQDGANKSFRKLRLDTKKSRKPAASPFASISHDDLSSETVKDGAQGCAVQPATYGSSLVTSEELETSTPESDEHADTVSPLRNQSSATKAHELEGSPTHDQIEIGHTSGGVHDIPMRPKLRAAPDEHHASQSLGQPLPKVRRKQEESSSRGDPESPSITPQDFVQKYKINPFTGEPVRRRTRRSDAAPRLPTLTSQDGETDYSGKDDTVIASVTSESAESSTEDYSTPSSLSNSWLLSPRETNSPSISPTFASDPWAGPLSTQGSLRSIHAMSRQSSLQTRRRRSSRMSASPGQSPAASFLYSANRTASSAAAPQPDDEGQTFGDEGTDQWVIGKQIGLGGFSTVKEIFSISASGKSVKRAVKIVRKSVPNKSESENDNFQDEFEHEIGIWRSVADDHILPLHVVYATDFATFCVMDLVEGGTLHDLVRKSRTAETRGVEPKLAKEYALQLASALRYLHEDIRIAHRDVKLENCLLDTSEPNPVNGAGHLKLCDFGLADWVGDGLEFSHPSMTYFDQQTPTPAKIASSPSAAKTVLGTLEYTAPEVLSTGRPLASPSVDIWAFGICVFALIAGELPYHHALKSKTAEMIERGLWDEDLIRAKLGGEELEQVLEFLRGCMAVDPNERWSVSEVLGCAWFGG